MPSPITLALIFLGISIIFSVLAIYKIFRIINAVMTLFFLVFSLGSFYMAYDVQQLQETLSVEPQMFIFDDDGYLATAFVSVNSSTPTAPDNINELRAQYGDVGPADLKGPATYVFVTTPETFEHISNVTIGEYVFEKEFIYTALSQEDPRQLYVDKILELNPELGRTTAVSLPDLPAEDFKSLLFAALSAEYLSNTNMAVGVSNGDIVPYPDSFTFKVLKKMPKPVLGLIINLG
jgi:hypothetical protein